MKKINLEKMGKELYPSVTYKGVCEIETLLNKLSESNSNFHMNTASLIKDLADILYAPGIKSTYNTIGLDKKFEGLKTGLHRNKELVRKLRTIVDEMEKEIISQEEITGSYEADLKSE